MTASQLFPADAALPTAASPEAPSAADSARLSKLFVAALSQALEGGRGGVMARIPDQKRVSTSLTAAADTAAGEEEKTADEEVGKWESGKVGKGEKEHGESSLPPFPLSPVPTCPPLESETPPPELVPLASVPDPSLACQSCYFAPLPATPALPMPAPPTKIAGGNAVNERANQPVGEKGISTDTQSLNPPLPASPTPLTFGLRLRNRRQRGRRGPC